MSDSKSPRRSGYAAKLERREREFQEEAKAERESRLAPLKQDQAQPLPPAERFESKNSHDDTVAGWKSLFKVGDVHHLAGVKLRVHHIGRRGVTFRKVSSLTLSLNVPVSKSEG